MTDMHLARVNDTLASQLVANAAAVYRAMTASDDQLDLGDGWAGIHFLLTGGDVPLPRNVAIERGMSWDDDSLENVLMGGEVTPYEDGLSGARYLSPRVVASMHQRLVSVSVEALIARFDPEVLEVLPEHWRSKRQPEIDLGNTYAALRQFYDNASRTGDAIVIWCQ